MNMTNPAPSVLTHGGDSDTAISSTIQTHSEVLDAQHPTVMQSTQRGAVPPRHLHYEEEQAGPELVTDEYEPKALHSTSKAGSAKVVKSAKEEQEALESGDWSLTPLEKVKNELGEIVHRVFVPESQEPPAES